MDARHVAWLVFYVVPRLGAAPTCHLTLHTKGFIGGKRVLLVEFVNQRVRMERQILFQILSMLGPMG